MYSEMVSDASVTWFLHFSTSRSPFPPSFLEFLYPPFSLPFILFLFWVASSVSACIFLAKAKEDLVAGFWPFLADLPVSIPFPSPSHFSFFFKTFFTFPFSSLSLLKKESAVLTVSCVGISCLWDLSVSDFFLWFEQLQSPLVHFFCFLVPAPTRGDGRYAAWFCLALVMCERGVSIRDRACIHGLDLRLR